MRNRALVALVTIVIAVFGLFAMRGLQQELAPSITFPQAAVVTSYPGAAPAVVANDVSNPVEAAIQSVPGLEQTSSTSNTNSSVVTAQFSYGTDMAAAEQKMTQAINRIKSTLPAGVDPQVVTGSFDDLPIIQFAVTTGDTSPGLADAVRATVLPELTKVEGVRDATLVGAVGQRVTITPDPAKLAEAGLSATAIRTALQQNGILLPGGEITQDGQTLTVSTGTKLSSTQDIESLPLLPTATAGSAPGGGPGAASRPAQIRTIGDVATVELTDNPVTSISRRQRRTRADHRGHQAARRQHRRRSPRRCRTRCPASQATWRAPSAAVTFTVVFDQAPFIQQSIDRLATEGLLGLLFAVLVILVFLLSVRATLVTAISIPTSVLITFIGLQAAGYTLNILTLGALTIAIGRVVDDSIVVIENIKRHLDIGAATRREAILAGGAGGRRRDHRLHHHDGRGVPADRLRRRHHGRAVPPVRADRHDRPAGVAAGRADHRAGAGVLVPRTASASAAGTSSRGHRERPRAALRMRTRPPTRLQRGTCRSSAGRLRRSVDRRWSWPSLVLVGTFALAPLMKTNFLGRRGQNTLTVTQQLAAGHRASTRSDDVGLQVERRDHRHARGQDRCRCPIGPAGSALRRAFLGGGGAAPSATRSPPTTDADQDALHEHGAGRARRRSSDAGDDHRRPPAADSAGTPTIEVDITAGSDARTCTTADGCHA